MTQSSNVVHSAACGPILPQDQVLRNGTSSVTIQWCTYWPVCRFYIWVLQVAGQPIHHATNITMGMFC